MTRSPCRQRVILSFSWKQPQTRKVRGQYWRATQAASTDWVAERLWMRPGEECTDPGNVHEEENRKDGDAQGQDQHELWLAIELLRVLHRALRAKRKPEIDGHQPGNERE